MEFANGEVFPITGRTAEIELELRGETTLEMSLSSKYQQMRERFVSQFLFNGRVAEYVDASVAGGKVKFADQTIYLGQALLAFASEVAILNSIGGDTSDAKSILSELLACIVELDQAAEPYCGSSAVAPNGFVLRDDISGPDDPRLNNRFAECDSDFQSPARENASPSGDQIFGLMYGLSAVVHLTGDAGLSNLASTISSRLFDYTQRNRFVLKLPNGDPTRRGSDMRWLSSLLHGLNQDITSEDHFDNCEIQILGQITGLTGVAAFWDDPVTARHIIRLVPPTIHESSINHWEPNCRRSAALNWAGVSEVSD